MAGITIKGGELKGLKKYLEGILTDQNPGVKVGVLEGATYADGPLAGESVARNMARHEFGATNIPARAPFRKTLETKKAEWIKNAATYLTASKGKIDVRAALTQTGDAMAMDIQQAFEDGLEPALKEATIKRKTKMGYGAHASKPVMLTGAGQKSIQSQYVDDLATVTGNK